MTSPDRIEMNLLRAQRLGVPDPGRHHGTVAGRGARIVLLAGQGCGPTRRSPKRVGVCVDAVRKWRHRWWVQPGTASLGDAKRSGRPPSFTPVQVAALKALACQPPGANGVPLSRWSPLDRAAQVVTDGIAASVSTSTVRRWPAEDAIKPWLCQSWIFIRDPELRRQGRGFLDLSDRVWDGKPLSPNDYFISADDEASIQPRCRWHHQWPRARPG
jgi:Homeodomain-like domain